MPKKLITDIGYGLWFGFTVYLLLTYQRTSIDWARVGFALLAVALYVLGSWLRRRAANRATGEPANPGSSQYDGSSPR